MKHSMFSLLFIAFSFAANANPAPTDIVKKYFALADAGDIAEVSKLLADDVTVTTPLTPDGAPKQAWLGLVQAFKVAFPDIQHEVVAYTESGYTVVARGVLKGQNNGPMMGNLPTGNRVSTPFNTIFELDKSWKIKAIYGQFDLKSFEGQLMAGIEPPMSGNKQVVLNIMQTLDKRNLDAVVAQFAPTCRFNGWAPEPLDANGYKQAMSGLIASFPDARFTVEDVVAEGDKVVVRHRFEGTHTGAAFQGVPTSNRRAVASATVTFQLKEGKPVELWLNADFLGIMAQIGGLPAVGK